MVGGGRVIRVLTTGDERRLDLADLAALVEQMGPVAVLVHLHASGLAAARILAAERARTPRWRWRRRARIDRAMPFIAAETTRCHRLVEDIVRAHAARGGGG